MPNRLQISVIITTYNWPQALELTIKSLNQQRTKVNFEIIIADDGSNKSTQNLIDQFKTTISHPIKHIWHADQGYRRSKILNKAILNSQGDYLVFVDGDCICPPNFIQQHAKLAEKNFFVAGSRVLITKQYTQDILKTKITPNHFNLINLIKLKLKKKCNKISTLIPLPLAKLRKCFPNRWQSAKGCNLGIWRQDIFQINGYDEQYEGWGHEDSDLVIRLINSNIKRKSGRFATTVIHLGHPILDRSNQQSNFANLMRTLTERKVMASLGINNPTPSHTSETVNL